MVSNDNLNIYDETKNGNLGPPNTPLTIIRFISIVQNYCENRHCLKFSLKYSEIVCYANQLTENGYKLALAPI